MFAQLGYYICVPFAWLTRLFYTWTGSYGVALILFTLLVKLVLLPFQLKSKKSMLRMTRSPSWRRLWDTPPRRRDRPLPMSRSIWPSSSTSTGRISTANSPVSST